MSVQQTHGARSVRARERATTVALHLVEDQTPDGADEPACSHGRRPLGWLFHQGPGGRLDTDGSDERR